MKPPRRLFRKLLALTSVCAGFVTLHAADSAPGLRLAREANWLIIRGDGLPEIRINYLEAYCRAGSTDADWVQHTVIKHTSETLAGSDDPHTVRLRDTLADGVTVEHTITARRDEVDFQLTARNPTGKPSEAHWAQPCVRLGAFTGFLDDTHNAEDYLSKCFIFVAGKVARLPTQPWSRAARYIPGQVWGAPRVPASDLNPRPHSSIQPSHGLIGCFSVDEQWIFATAWEPYQELFQGVARCLHSDLRIGGLAPGETKQIRGKIYLVPNDVPALLARYTRDFPEHRVSNR